MPDTLHTSDTLDLTLLPFWQWDSVSVHPQSSALDSQFSTGIPLDSILPPLPAADTVFRPSLFLNHTLQVSNDTLMPRPDEGRPAWMFVSVVLLATILCIYYRLRKIKFITLLQSLFSLRTMDRLVRECNLSHGSLLIPMGLLLTTSLSLPVHQLMLPDSGLLGYLAIIVILAVLYLLRNGIMHLLGNAFDDTASVNLYITSNYLFHLLEATVVTLLLFPLLYMPRAAHSVAVIIVFFLSIALIFRLSRSVKVFLTNSNSSSFYLFYYLCIVETIPVLAIIKWFIEQ
jgi:hypothetical protein